MGLIFNIGRRGGDITAASTIYLGGPAPGFSGTFTKDGDWYEVNGTTGITAIQTQARQIGARFFLKFNDVVTLTNGAALALRGGADYTTTAGDVLLFETVATNQVAQVVLANNGGTGSGLAANQLIEWREVSANHQMAFKGSAATSTEFVITADAATLEALLNTAYDTEGITCVIDVKQNSDAIGSYNGTCFIVFPTPQSLVQVLGAAIINVQVSEGDGGDYAIAGGSSFTLGQSDADIQTAVQAAGGNYAAAMVDGSSTSPFGGKPTKVVVSGAGSGVVNQDYTWDGATLTNGEPTYISADTTITIYSDGTGDWGIYPAAGGGSYYYVNGGNVGDPSPGSWQVHGGGGPAPTLVSSDFIGGVDATADLNVYVPLSVGAVSNPSVTGTGATSTVALAYGATEPAAAIGPSPVASLGAPEVGTTPGTVVAFMSAFDQTGARIGYAPLYGSYS